MGSETKNTTGIRRCDFCKCSENEPHPKGGFTVKLKEIEVLNTTKLACQRCGKQVRQIKNSNTAFPLFQYSLLSLIYKVLSYWRVSDSSGVYRSHEG